MFGKFWKKLLNRKGLTDKKVEQDTLEYNNTPPSKEKHITRSKKSKKVIDCFFALFIFCTVLFGGVANNATTVQAANFPSRVVNIGGYITLQGSYSVSVWRSGNTVYCKVHVDVSAPNGAYQSMGASMSTNHGSASKTFVGDGAATPKRGSGDIQFSFTDSGAGTISGTVYAGFARYLNSTYALTASINASYAANTYTNYIDHWMWGFTKGEGNNGDKRAWKIKTTSFTKRAGQGYTLAAGDAVRVPNGFSLSNTFGTASINGKWSSFNLGYSGSQPTKNMYIEYDYSPISYSISYNMNGGTNASSNPSTYNVLYGVNFATPTRPGYNFLGWYINGNKVSGINVGANASFSSESDMYNKLSSRTTGDKTVEARWEKNSYTISIDPNGGSYNGSTGVTKINQAPGKFVEINQIPTRSGYTFIGWKRSGSGSLHSGHSYNQSGITQYEKADSDGTAYTNYKMNFDNTTNTGYAYPSIQYFSYGYTSGHTYRLSVDVRVNKSSNNEYAHIRHSAFVNNWVAPSTTVNYLTNGWEHRTVERTFTGTTSEQSGTNYNIYPFVEFYAGIAGGKRGILDFDMKNLTIYDVTAGKYVTSNHNSIKNGATVDVGKGDTTITAVWVPNNTITYKAGNGGSVSRTSETVEGYKDALGSSATAGTGYKFDGWYGSGVKVSSNANFVPGNPNNSLEQPLGSGYYNGEVLSYDSTNKTYTIKASASDMSTSWGSGAEPYTKNNDIIPWGKYFTATFDVWSPIDAKIQVDINNMTVDGVNASGNDNDVGRGGTTAISLKANTWTTVSFWYQNASSTNASQAALRNYSGIGLIWDTSKGDQTFKIRNYQTMVSNNIVGSAREYEARFVPNQYQQTVRVRFENADGSFTGYSQAYQANHNYDSTFEWEFPASQQYESTKVSYKVTGAKSTDVTVYRKKYTVKILTKTQKLDGTWPDSYSDVSSRYVKSSYRYGEECRAQISIIGAPDTEYPYWEAFTVTENKELKYDLKRHKKTLKIYASLSDKIDEERENKYFTFDFYVADKLVRQSVYNVNDVSIYYGNNYTIKNIQPRNGYHYTNMYFSRNPIHNLGKPTKDENGVFNGYFSGESTYQYSLCISPNTYTINYNGNGATSGTTTSSSHTYNESKSLTKNGFTRTGYTFKGWATNADGSGTIYSDGQEVRNVSTKNGDIITLYAQWTPASYQQTVRVRFENADGSFGGYSQAYQANHTYGSTFEWSYPENPQYQSTKVSYTVTGVKTTDVTVYRKKYLLYIEGDDGVNSISGTGTFRYGTNASVTYRLKPGYHFVKSTGTTSDGNQNGSWTGLAGKEGVIQDTWYITCYREIQLHTELINYSISYNLNGGSMSGQKTSYNVNTATFTLPTPSKTGYAFTGWTGSNGSTPQTNVNINKGSTGNKSYTANWKANAYTLTVNPNGGNINGTTSAKSLNPPLYYNSGNWWNLSGEKPSRTGYTFEGWYTSANGGTKIYNADGTCTNEGTYWKDNSYVHTGNLLVYAHWKANTYTVTYNANKGSGSMSPDTVTYNTAYKTKKNTFTRTGYTFNGWNEKADGTGTAWTLTSSGVYEANKTWTWTYTHDITLYAQWKVNTYTNSIDHWAGGFKNKEGNNSSKSWFALRTTTFNKNYGETFSMNDSLATAIPNGFYLMSKFGTSSLEGTWKTYEKPYSITQPAKDMSFEYDYYPYDYSITYNLDGGTNNSANPNKYNVLYGVSLKNPTKTGYTFLGWYDNTDLIAYNKYEIASETTINGNNYVFKNTTNGNVLNAFQIQTWKDGTYLETFAGGSQTGNHQEKYIHNRDTGNYTIRLKANGSTKDSSVYYYNVYLEKGKAYSISYNIEKCTSSEVVVKNLSFSRSDKISGINEGTNASFSSSDELYAKLKNRQTGNINLTAKWTPNEYTLTLNPNGGNIKGNTNAQSLNPSLYYDRGNWWYVGSMTPSRVGYSFNGWFDSPSGGIKVYDNEGNCTNDGKYWKDKQYKYLGNLTVYAQWKPNNYTYNIKYVSSSGKSLGNNTVTGTFDTSKTITPPAKTGYTTPAAQTVKFDSTGAKTITFTYPLINYTISYDVNGGNTLLGQRTSYNVESSAYTLPIPSRIGYKFTGWTGNNGTTPQKSVTIAASSTGNKSYKANWEANSLTVRYHSNGAFGGNKYENSSWKNDIIFDYGQSTDTIVYIQNLEEGSAANNGLQTYGLYDYSWKRKNDIYMYKNGYIGTGKYNTKSNSSGIEIDENKTFNSVIELANYLGVSIDSKDNSIDLYPQWKAISYSIIYNGNGATSGSMSEQPATFDKNVELAPNSFSRKYTVTYNAMGGTVNAPNNVATSTFKGWEDRGNISFMDKNYSYNDFDTPYYSQKYTDLNAAFGFNKYNLIKHYVLYGKSEGRNTKDNAGNAGLYPNKATVKNMTITNGYKVNLYANWKLGSVTLPTPTRFGYKFIGWYTSAEGGTKITGATYTPTSNVTLYAHWKLDSYYIDYNVNDTGLTDRIVDNLPDNNGSLPGKETAVMLTDFALQNGSKYNTKYTFKEWNTKPDGSGKKFTTSITNDGSLCKPGETLTLYAQWDTTPTITGKNFYILENMKPASDILTSGKGLDKNPIDHFPDNMKDVAYPVKGYTKNGTDISSKINVDYVEFDGSKTATASIDTKKPGKYTVHYSLTDGKQTKKFIRTITVLSASTPVINAGDRYFNKGSFVTAEMLLSTVTSGDRYDGDLTTKVAVLNMENVAFNTVGSYDIQYKVTNRSGKTVVKKVKIHILEYLTDNQADKDNKYRYIRKDCSTKNDYCMEYFKEDSKWVTNDELNNQIIDSLSKDKSEEAIKKYHFGQDDVERFKQ